MDRRSQFKALKGAHFFDVKIKEGKRSVRVSGANQRLVVQCLFEYLGENTFCFPSQLTISVWCGFTSPEQLEQYRATGKLPSLNTIKRILRALEENYYIEVKRRKIESGGRKTQNTYSICWINIKALNGHQTAFDFEYQSPIVPNQSPTERYQSPTAQISKSHTWDTETTTETPQKSPINKPQEDTGLEEFENLRDRYSSQLENASKVDRQTQYLVDLLGIRQADDVRELQILVLENGQYTDFSDAIEQTRRFVESKHIPLGHRRLKAFKTIFSRINEESMCK